MDIHSALLAEWPEIHWALLTVGAIVTLVVVYFGFTSADRSLPVALMAMAITVFSCVQIFWWWKIQRPPNFIWAGIYTFVAWMSLAAGIRQFLLPFAARALAAEEEERRREEERKNW